uniref:Uncharacterized protein n=1 Tax=Panagrolaimus sp. JU765 TaxID=591449 RepID=A0AC34RQ26_9BILA
MKFFGKKSSEEKSKENKLTTEESEDNNPTVFEKVKAVTRPAVAKGRKHSHPLLNGKK